MMHAVSLLFLRKSSSNLMKKAFSLMLYYYERALTPPFFPLFVHLCKSLNDAECGIENISTRIVNGSRVKDNTYPWIVYIMVETELGRAAACTGSIINDRFIMTAAHCVSHGKYVKHTADPSKVLVFKGPSCLHDLRSTTPLLV